MITDFIEYKLIIMLFIVLALYKEWIVSQPNSFHLTAWTPRLDVASVFGADVKDGIY